MIVLRETVTDDDAMAMRDVPDGWLCVPVLGWYWIGRACELTGEELHPLGPYQTVREAVEAANMDDQRTRQEAE
jgi:hypothetical protein